MARLGMASCLGSQNLVEDGANCGFANGVNNAVAGVKPVLGPLANNGGETNPTPCSAACSPAIDAGDTTLTTNQRHSCRHQAAGRRHGRLEG